MKVYRNERGYALLSVLITIIIILSFAMILIPKTLNTSLQVNKSEGAAQAKDMSEMGIHYAHAYLQSQVTQAITDTKNDVNYTVVNTDKLFCEKLTSRLSQFSGTIPKYNKEIEMTSNANYSFKLKYFEPYDINSTNDLSCDGFEGMTVPIESIGKVLGKSQKSVKAYFLIENKGEEDGERRPGSTEPVDPSTLTFDIVKNVDFRTHSTSDLPSVHFLNLVTIDGNGKLIINGNAWFEGSTEKDNGNGNQKELYSVDFNGQNGKIFISGDAYFKYPVEFKHGNYICIRGNSYKLRSGTTNQYDPYTEIKNETNCPPSVEQEVDFSNIDEWGIIDSELNVIY